MTSGTNVPAPCEATAVDTGIADSADGLASWLNAALRYLPTGLLGSSHPAVSGA